MDAFAIAGIPEQLCANYVAIFIFMAVVAVFLPLTLLLAKLVRPTIRAKQTDAYECGIDPIDNAAAVTRPLLHHRILFVVFDVETIFLFPWAVKFKALACSTGGDLIFLVILIVGTSGLGKGALEWV